MHIRILILKERYIPCIYVLFNVQGTPKEINALCALLQRISSPCRYLDMVHPFSITIPRIGMTCNNVLSLIYDRWCHSTSMVITQKFNNIL